MRAQIWGGPHDGQILDVPEHVPHIRIPVPGQTRTSASFTSAANLLGIPIAVYTRCDLLNGRVRYQYMGQE